MQLEDLKTSLRSMSEEELVNFIAGIRQSRVTAKEGDTPAKAAKKRQAKPKLTPAQLVAALSPKEAANLIAKLEADLAKDKG